MRAHPLPEARRYADLMLEELRKVIPSFLQRIDRPERGGVWSDYLASTRDGTARVVEELFPDLVAPEDAPHRARRGLPRSPWSTSTRRARTRCWRPSAAPLTGRSEEEVLRRVGELGAEDRRSLLRAYVGDRTNRRHRPGRAFERTDYRFDVVTDYGAFRDLQRHRMLTIEWQPLGPALGYDIPDTVEEAGLTDRYVASLERSRELHEAMAPAFPVESAYAVALAYRLRYSMQMNAREAMHLIELRSGPQGHAAYRVGGPGHAPADREVAGHRLLAEAMSFVDYGDHDLERLESERRAEERRATAPGV